MDSKQLAKALQTQHPFLDDMMAETLAFAYENGTLAEHIKKLPEEPPQPTAAVIPGSIEVLSPDEKSSAIDSINEGADIEDDLP